MKREAALFSLALAWLADSSGSAASSLEREERLGEEMVMNLFDGEVVEIGDGERDFLAASIERDSPRGTVILLHGRGFHADWQDVVGPLRVRLAEDGWNTLSLQMPVLDADAKYYDYVPTFPAADRRIDAGIAYARERSDGPVVILAHSCGAHMIMHRIGQQGVDGIDALATAGLGATDWGQDPVEPFAFERIDVPFLDALGSDEYERVMNLAADRVEAVKATHDSSAQIYVDGADHYFKGRNAELGDAVSAWLDEVFPK